MAHVDHFEIPTDDIVRALAHGGAQLGEIQPLSETGRWVYITDSEGNIIGLYDEQGAAA